jgi:hypothetical protein
LLVVYRAKVRQVLQFLFLAAAKLPFSAEMGAETEVSKQLYYKNF